MTLTMPASAAYSQYNPRTGRGSTTPSHHPSLLGKGNTTISLISKSGRQKKQDSAASKDKATDYNLVAPIRQTASIFKQPVTVIKDHKSRVKNDLKLVNKEKPCQLFWTRRLGNLAPSSYAQEEEDKIEVIVPPPTKKSKNDKKSRGGGAGSPRGTSSLPLKVDSVGPGITETMLLASISTHLHLSKEPAEGQKESLATIDKNPTAFINPHQPLMANITVSDDDIHAAEQRVRQARLRLAQAIKSLG
eukprot:TRINITY_DN18610_c0_g1_i7.p1 TRINITY_DN18610_c0_g1~~TRINITY_DN18610_c0_g1_i7.p1  ORF type:complete len:247 (-),score=51.43 TRINITY_DN18610_c0_g1_i7:302-1042(-)